MEKKVTKGYKVFKEDWTCRGFKYEVGEVYEQKEPPKICFKGFHFCKNLTDCFKYYDLNPLNRVAEVEASGDVVESKEDSKCCTNKIKVVKEIKWNEVLTLINSSNYNSGYRNTGYRNSGDCNTGYRNSGDYNSGERNSGNYNSGDYNSGDYNSTCYSNGCFNTKNQKITFFNKKSDWTYEDWLNSKARLILSRCPQKETVWVKEELMTDKEKAENLEYKTTGGFLRVQEKEEEKQAWWEGLNPAEKESILNLPNFDSDIFKEITGIDVNLG